MRDAAKKAVLISCSDHYAHRLNVIDECLKEMGYQTAYITSDFDHTAKDVYLCSVPGSVQIHARPYRKNLSAQRILSHRDFARDVFRYLDSLPSDPDVVVALLPPNFLAHYTEKYKKKHPNVKIIFDIFDLWPETFPSNRAKKLLAPAFGAWAWVRDHSLPSADFITTECDLFRQRLKLNEQKSATVYLCANPLPWDMRDVHLQEDKIELCYLGAINNVISVPDICDLIAELTKRKPVTLHIIGKGERQQEFIDSALASGASVNFYGAIYDEAKKQEIMNQCHFGLNVMKSSVCVGLTMKSVDYFRYGLPIINSIPVDTQRLVEEKSVGVQLDSDCARKLVALTKDECLQMRKNVKSVFDSTFAHSVIKEKFKEILKTIL